MKNFKEYARHILDEINFIKNHCTGKSFDDFNNDELLKRAIIRSLEIIGEAVKNIPQDILDQYPNTEWKNIAKTRDRLIHHYFGIDYTIVWDIVEKHIDLLKQDIDSILAT